ncbi:MAG: M48 family metalloprotease [bacterium]|nr:M48 family metalloprotease [bacterium]
MSDLFLLPDIHIASSAIVMWLAEGLLFGTALATLTWLLIRLLGRRRHAAIEVALWSIVLLKFLIPLGPASSFSLASLCVRVTGHSPGPLVSGELGMLMPESQGSTADALGPVGALGASASWNWMTAVSAVYLPVVLVLLTIRVRGYRALAARCRALPAADAATCNLVARLCRELRPRCVPSVRVDAQSSATFVIGLFQPLIVISGRQLARPRELEAVIVHELAHLKRGDMLVRCLQWFVSTLLFFWPVVAWVNRRIDEAREYACDAWALRHGTLTAGEYARCLFGAIQPMRLTPLTYRPPCMAGHPSTIERRINMVLKSTDRPSTGRRWGLPALLLVLAWSVFTLTGVVDANPDSQHSEKQWAATEKAFQAHLEEVMTQVGDYDVADLDGDGELSYWEKTTFVTTLALSQAEALVEAYPYADADQDGELNATEACDFVRGLTLVHEIEKRGQFDHQAAVESGDDDKEAAKAIKARIHEERLVAFHEALDAQQWLLAQMTAVPDTEDLMSNHAFIMENFAKKKKKRTKHVSASAEKAVQHLVAKIEDIKKQLATETDSKRIAKLEAVLKELEAKAADLKAELVAEDREAPKRKKTGQG